MSNLLEVKNLSKNFTSRVRLGAEKSVVQAVSNISFELAQGESLGLVGESGCGKSTTGRIIAKLIEPTSGQIIFNGQDITKFSEKDMKPIRGDIQMIFQDPFSSLNPRQTVGSIIGMPFKVNSIEPKQGLKPKVQELLEMVGLNPEHYNRFPHEFSGGQRQRIGIARAIALNPKLLICDEPVSALDVSIQAQILNLLNDLRRELNLSLIFIAHDLAVVRNFCDRVAVMYLGKLAEVGSGDEIFDHPHHPYSKALLSAVPVPNPLRTKSNRIHLEGDVPSPINPPSGCRFRTRCWKAQEICASTEPVLHSVSKSEVACHFPE
ncbi:MAG: oligopeptide/dipeptide ABC transporter ATP-binding protein [Actinomycetes bacterium]